jgi:hypothetical protein
MKTMSDELEPFPLSNEEVDLLLEQNLAKYINVKGREEHEALLNDYPKMIELGLDPYYERIVYLNRWGGYLNDVR